MACIVWFVINFLLAWLIFGGGWLVFLWLLIIYAVTISFALSGAGEALFRKLESAREVLTEKEKDYLLPIFNEVYQNTRKTNKNLKPDIKLYIQDDSNINAFALGKRTIMITRGAINTFSEDELKGVLAHEFGHLAYKDTTLLMLNTIGNGIKESLYRLQELSMSEKRTIQEDLFASHPIIARRIENAESYMIGDSE